MNQLIKLIAETESRDEYGAWKTVETETSVFADISSLSQTEFYKASSNDLFGGIKVTLADCLDYNGEKKLKYKAFGATDWTEYRITRTYVNGTKQELTCEKAVE